MYEPHPVFKQPEDEQIRVWRYMDFTKLVSLLNSESLFFCRADKLEDRFEGAWPEKNINKRETVPPDVSPKLKDSYKQVLINQRKKRRHFRKYYAINCWHMNEHESAAMWKLYLKSNEGIAIRSTYSKLKESIIDKEIIRMGVVNYIDYENDYIKEPHNWFKAYTHKRKSFEFEREIRAIIAKMPMGAFDPSIETISNGVNVKIDISILVEKIFVAPDSPSWFYNLVNSVVSQYGFNLEVKQSKLNVDPIY